MEIMAYYGIELDGWASTKTLTTWRVDWWETRLIPENQNKTSFHNWLEGEQALKKKERYILDLLSVTYDFEVEKKAFLSFLVNAFIIFCSSYPQKRLKPLTNYNHSQNVWD